MTLGLLNDFAVLGTDSEAPERSMDSNALEELWLERV